MSRQALGNGLRSSAILVFLLASAGCTASYRYMDVDDPRIDTVFYLSNHWTSSDPRSPHFFANGKFGALGVNHVTSRVVAGGADKWSGMTLELEGGHRWPLVDTGTGAFVGGVGAQFDFYRFVEHLSGPSGTHDDLTDPHRTPIRWGAGLSASLGYVQKTGPAETAAVEPNVALGLTSIDDIGHGWFVEGGFTVAW